MEKQEILKYLANNNVKNGDVLKEFLETDQEHYLRSNQFGHITGSSFILNDTMDEALLILHKKYNKWLAAGGHVDENETAKQASKRESGEEVGLDKLELLKPEIFDIDVHRVPAATKKDVFEPEHWHFDVRYLYKAEKGAKVEANMEETNGFKWNNLKMLTTVDDESIKRQATKAIEFVESLKNKPKRKFKI
jgi:ADP-ribose pyrophosphatase YjhB (NUDIX family)